MAAIAGIAYADPKKHGEKELVQAMALVMQHRGKDGGETYIAKGISLAVRHKGKYDSQNASQSFHTEQNRLTVVCDSRIVNYSELAEGLTRAGHKLPAKSEALLIAHLYQEYGLEFISRLRGIFALAIWDAAAGKLILARDRFGVKPLHYACDSSGLSFGSEQKALLVNPGVSRQVSSQSISELFNFGFIFSPKTLFASIHQVPPGTILSYDNNNLALRKYWDYPFYFHDRIDIKRSEAEWSEMLRAKLEEVVRLYVQSDPHPGAWLSGGLDSSAIVSLMLHSGLSNIPVTMLHWQQNGFNEIADQKTLLNFPEYSIEPHHVVSSMAGLNKLPEALWSSETPTASGLEILRLLLAEKSAAKTGTVFLGEGADEVFGGYSWYRTNKVLHLCSFFPRPVRKAISRFPLHRNRFKKARALLDGPYEYDLKWYRTILLGTTRPATLPIFSRSIQEAISNNSNWEVVKLLPESLSKADPFNRLQYYDVTVRLPSLVAFNVDPIAMSKGLEVRFPFLDHELIDLAAQIPPRRKLKGLTEKHILRRAMRDLLPPEICQRPKRGLMAPVSSWFNQELPEFAREMLSESEIRKTGYFEPEAVSQLIKEHHKKHNWAYALCGVLGVQLWDCMLRRGKGPLSL